MIVFLIQLLLCVAKTPTYNAPCAGRHPAREAPIADVGNRAFKGRVWSRVYNRQI